MLERQLKSRSALRGVRTARSSDRSEADPARGTVVAWKISAAVDRDIYQMDGDGRPHPSDSAFYPFSGFTTGAWEGASTLTAHTTHIIGTVDLRRNGVPSSDCATVDWRIFRHGDLLTIMGIITDPIDLTEPDVVTRTWQLDPRLLCHPHRRSASP